MTAIFLNHDEALCPTCMGSGHVPSAITSIATLCYRCLGLRKVPIWPAYAALREKTEPDNKPDNGEVAR